MTVPELQADGVSVSIMHVTRYDFPGALLQGWTPLVDLLITCLRIIFGEMVLLFSRLVLSLSLEKGS